MRGSVHKRCRNCGRRVKGHRCAECGGGYTWGFVLDLKRGPEGERRQMRRSGYRTRGEAEEALRDVLSEIDRATFIDPSGLTVADYLRDEWLPVMRSRVRWKTWNDRRQQLETHVIPRIGDVLLQELSHTDLNKLYADLLEDGRVRGDGGLSASSVHGIHRIIRVALNDAVRWGLLRRNPALISDPPPMKEIKAARRRAMKTWNGDQARAFLEATRGDELHPLWQFGLTTGMRRSELLGLRWSDVDLDAGTATVRHTVLEAEDGWEIADDQKSVSSGRTIHLDSRTVALLREHRERQLERRRQAGDAWRDDDLVFADEGGSHLLPNRVTKAFLRATRETGLPHIRLHGLRHTHGTLMLLGGINPKVIAERMGHSSVAFFLDTYGHVLPGMDPDAAEHLADIVLGDAEADAADSEYDTDDGSRGVDAQDGADASPDVADKSDEGGEAA